MTVQGSGASGHVADVLLPTPGHLQVEEFWTTDRAPRTPRSHSVMGFKGTGRKHERVHTHLHSRVDRDAINARGSLVNPNADTVMLSCVAYHLARAFSSHIVGDAQTGGPLVRAVHFTQKHLTRRPRHGVSGTSRHHCITQYMSQSQFLRIYGQKVEDVDREHSHPN
jgi:hypothetical protein